MKFSVVIVNYDSWPHTLRCVEALHRTGCASFDVIVVDNGREKPPGLPGTVRLIRNSENVGFARACNQGIAASGGDCIVLINPDTLVERDFFEVLEEFLEGKPEVGIVGPRVVDGYGNLQLSARREIGLLSGLLGRTSFLTRLFSNSTMVKRMFPAAGSLDGPAEVDWVSGACMAVRREVLEAVGGLDERFFMYFEDADLCRRSRRSGWPVYYLPQLEILHLTGASSRRKLRAIWMLHRSAFLYHRKYGPHGPFGLYSLLVLLGLCARGLTKSAVSLLGR
ncbi:MAG: glycosyltransferase family 2 protein [Actinomycetota bacterium]|nr:glycosyltransferase family 2 protein [Actinomycetota bacterium]